MNITKDNAYSVMKELEHQANEMNNSHSGSFDEMKGNILQSEIVSAIQVVEHEKSLQRSDSDIFNFFANEKLTHTWDTDIDGKVVACKIHKEGFFDPLVIMPCEGINPNGLRRAIEYIMDMEEL